MREITAHQIDELNKQIIIRVSDEPGPGGANHEYKVEIPWGEKETMVFPIPFQKGPLQEVGEVNGLTHEVLIAILIDRLKRLQKSEFACVENAQALQYLTAAFRWLEKRTRRWEQEGTEGTSVP